MPPGGAAIAAALRNTNANMKAILDIEASTWLPGDYTPRPVKHVRRGPDNVANRRQEFADTGAWPARTRHAGGALARGSPAGADARIRA